MTEQKQKISQELLDKKENNRRYRPYPEYKDSGIDWLQNIPVHWELIKLKRLSNIETGSTPPKSEDSYYGGDILWVKPENLNETVPIEETQEKLTEKGAKKVPLLKPKTPLVQGIGSIGKVGFSNRKVATNQQINAVKLKGNRWTSSFAIYYLIAAEQEHKKHAYTNVVSILNERRHGQIKALVPPLQKQRSIAKFLDRETSKLNQLIQKKEELIELLEEKRITLITEKVTKGLDPDVEMKDSGVDWLNEIPKNWEERKLGTLVSINPSKSNIPADKLNKEATFLPMKNIGFGKIQDDRETGKIEDLVDNYTYFKEGDVLVAKITPCFENGKGAIAKNLKNGIGFGTTELHVLSSFSEDVLRRFIYYITISDYFRSVGEGMMKGSAGQKRITYNFVKDFTVFVPPKKEQKEIVNYLDKNSIKIKELVIKIEEAIKKLKEYKKALISEAVTGKIDVRGEVE